MLRAAPGLRPSTPVHAVPDPHTPSHALSLRALPFRYMDLDERRPSVMSIMDDYWAKLPAYQGVELDDLQMRRVLFGLFVSYKDSPLPVP